MSGHLIQVWTLYKKSKQKKNQKAIVNNEELKALNMS
jgi:hypothetical protein